MSEPFSAAAPAPWKQRYEDLRSHVLEGRRSLGADPQSLVLLCRQGLAGWMRSWRQMMIAPAPRLPLVPAELPLPRTPFWQQQLTVLLAQMTAQHLSII